MMNIQGKIPIVVQPVFWLTAGILGYLTTSSLVGVLVWALAIAVSILGHEMGHALVAYLFGLSPAIELGAFGGATFHRPAPSKFKELLIVIAGPFFSILLYVLSSFLMSTFLLVNPITRQFFQAMQWINLIWTILNLVPVLPLDGGQILRILLQSIFPNKGYQLAFFFSSIFGFIAAGFFFLQGQYFPGGFFLYFSYQSFIAFRQIRG